MKRWAKYAKPYWPYFVLGPLCMIIEVLGEITMPKLLAGIIDYGTGMKDINEASAFIRKVYEIAGDKSPFIVAIMCAMILTAKSLRNSASTDFRILQTEKSWTAGLTSWDAL